MGVSMATITTLSEVKSWLWIRYQKLMTPDYYNDTARNARNVGIVTLCILLNCFKLLNLFSRNVTTSKF